jgi:RNA polymerase sigma factor (sigma-70 family)
MTIPAPEDLARQAVEGHRQALDELVTQLQADVYRLAVRMLWNREDAEDATQDILVKVVTRLAQFDFRSQLRTWVYRIAVNHLLDVRKSPVERMRLTFETFAEDLAAGLSDAGPRASERSLLVEEVKIGCTLAMLQCLDRPHRMAYVLGEIFELAGPEAAAALEISPALFRKRLQLARETIVSFTRQHCGLVADAAECACHRRVPAAVTAGRVDAEALQFAGASSSFDEARAMIRRVEEARRTIVLHQAATPRESSVDFARRIRDTFDADRSRA